MRKAIVGMCGIVTSLLILSPLASARIRLLHNPSAYLGFNALYVSTNGFSRTLKNGQRFNSSDAATGASRLNVSGARPYIGYRLNNYLAFEAAYDLYQNAFWKDDSTNITIRNKEDAFEGLARFSYPITPTFSAFGKYGLAYVSSRMQGNAAGTTFIGQSFTKQEIHKRLPAFGLGVGLKVYNTQLVFNWLRIHGRDDIHTIDYAAIGVEYYFD